MFRPILAMLVDDGRATDNGLEAGGLTLNKGSHFTSVAIANQRHAVAVDGLGLQHGIDSGHDVPIVAAPEIIFVSGREGCAIPRTAARMGPQYGPAVPQQEINPGLMRVGISAEWASMHLHDKWY